MIADLWYRNSVIYSLDVETFLDASGDGVGDFEGLVRRLDYLDALGVDTLWIAPFQPTPDRDDGYDISDFYGVDPRYGSSGDFVEFMREARKRGMKVIIDLVLNHTSDRHRWFQEARRNEESPRRDWYVWSEKRPPHWRKGTVFPGHQKGTWTYDKKAGAWYHHRFFEFQPDLNAANPAVREEMHRILGYWLELGVAGCRIDAVPFIIELTTPKRAKAKQDFELLYGLRRFAQLRRGDSVLLGEANVPPGGQAKYFGPRGEGLQMMFNFWVNQHLFYALASGDARPLADALRATRRIPEGAQWAQFLRNHDELDLGRLTEAQRQRVFDRFAPEERMQLYGRGIRRRLAPMLGDRPHLELAYSLLFSLPGTPVIRYGDEIGMGDDLSLPQRDAVRTPMQWSDDPQAGFSTARKLEHPIIADGSVWDYRRVNVEAQQRDPASLFSWTARMIRLRKECPEIGWGTWTTIATGFPDVLALRYDWRGNSIVVVHNFAEMPRSVRLRVGGDGGDRLVDLREEEESRANASGVHRIALDAFGYKWYRVGNLNYAVRRERQ
ncbi:MAG TPA: alpha-amylase family protein [Gemmatimonadaceae bacterium]|nr:alpha-amylase family protein [Gemmatimonadaceae bacterium]